MTPTQPPRDPGADGPVDVERLLRPEDLAEYLGIPIGTLYQWRYRGEGPRGFRVGRHVRYRMADVQTWLEARAS
jgi:excisionase family DNA binding protein